MLGISYKFNQKWNLDLGFHVLVELALFPRESSLDPSLQDEAWTPFCLLNSACFQANLAMTQQPGGVDQG